MSDGNDFSKLMPLLDDAFQHYYNFGHAVMTVEMLKQHRETGDMSMETVSIVLLDPTSYKFLSAMIPLLHSPETQHHLLDVIEDTLARAKKDEDSDPESE